SHLLGVAVEDEYVLGSGGREILFLHGHTFDDFVDSHPILTWVGDCIYAALLWIDKSHAIARMAKRGSKTFLRCARKVEVGAAEPRCREGRDGVWRGHTHVAMSSCGQGVEYFNSGCWTESPCTYLTVECGRVCLHSFDLGTARSAKTAEHTLVS